ncbi:MAG: 30S ribosomal protein S12 methylthiotransferase RimO [Bacillota bacterium]|nr:30S ribosomal protein S12 methylthiotransferase RimO [Bacillota bacterium]
MNKKNVYFTTLGCSKNDVDTDQMRTILEGDHYQSAYSPDQADLIVVNTCGFIEDAKEESINEILEMADYTKDSKKKLLVTGCLAQRYAKELLDQIPEIDGIIGTGQINNIAKLVDQSFQGKRIKETTNINSAYQEGLYKKDVGPTEYVKIGEGCNNFCSYCIIPMLRGKNRSRKIEDIYKEVSYLVEKGAREIILIAQNTTDYGIDNYGDYSLAKLLNKLEEIQDLKWIRVLYLYPDNFTDDLIAAFKNNKKLLPYVDIPLQHVSDRVLKNMNRSTDKETIRKLIEKLRREVPNIIIRSTFIVGFPQESQEDFEELVDFIKEVKLDKVGVFEYSQEENTKAYEMDGQIDPQTKAQRKAYLMEVQEEISNENMEKFLGKTYDMLIEEIYDDLLVGRTISDSPEIDGVTLVYGPFDKDYQLGQFIKVKIIDHLEHDLIGGIYEPSK